MPEELLSAFKILSSKAAQQMKGWRESNIYDSDLRIPKNKISRPPYFQNRIIMFCHSFFTFMYMQAIYIFPGSVCLFCCIYISRPILGIYNRSQIHKYRRGCAVSFLGIHKSDFRYRPHRATCSARDWE